MTRHYPTLIFAALIVVSFILVFPAAYQRYTESTVLADTQSHTDLEADDEGWKSKRLIHGAYDYTWLEGHMYSDPFNTLGDEFAGRETNYNEAWVYLTTSAAENRSEITAMFDQAFEDILPLVDDGKPNSLTTYGYVDCGDTRGCGQNFLRPPPYFRGPLERVEWLSLEPPGLWHVKICHRWEEEYKYYRHFYMQRFFRFPLKELGCQQNITIEQDEGHEVQVPSFPSALEQMKYIFARREAIIENCSREDASSALWEGQADWLVFGEERVRPICGGPWGPRT